MHIPTKGKVWNRWKCILNFLKGNPHYYNAKLSDVCVLKPFYLKMCLGIIKIGIWNLMSILNLVRIIID